MKYGLKQDSIFKISCIWNALGEIFSFENKELLINVMVTVTQNNLNDRFDDTKDFNYTISLTSLSVMLIERISQIKLC